MKLTTGTHLRYLTAYGIQRSERLWPGQMDNARFMRELALAYSE